MGGTASVYAEALSPIDGKPLSLPGYNTGDIVGFDLDCGAECDAIEAATLKQSERLYKIRLPRLSHIGIYRKNQNGTGSILDTTKVSGVRIIPFHTAIRSLKGGMNEAGGFYPFRWDPELRIYGYRGFKRAEKRLGTPYDETYTDPKRPYCELLLQQVFLGARGKHLFDLLPMEFGEPGTPERLAWEKLAQERGFELPIGKPGLSPTAAIAQGLTRGYLLSSAEFPPIEPAK